MTNPTPRQVLRIAEELLEAVKNEVEEPKRPSKHGGSRNPYHHSSDGWEYGRTTNGRLAATVWSDDIEYVIPLDQINQTEKTRLAEHLIALGVCIRASLKV